MYTEVPFTQPLLHSGRVVALVTAEWCRQCPAAKQRARAEIQTAPGTGVFTVVDIGETPEAWGKMLYSIPSFVHLVDGEAHFVIGGQHAQTAAGVALAFREA